MEKYRVNFSGFAYVRANDPDEAKERLESGEVVYMETKYDPVEEVDEFVVII